MSQRLEKTAFTYPEDRMEFRHVFGINNTTEKAMEVSWV
jgi:hypothetical protein